MINVKVKSAKVSYKKNKIGGKWRLEVIHKKGRHVFYYHHKSDVYAVKKEYLENGISIGGDYAKETYKLIQSLSKRIKKLESLLCVNSWS